ncbi:hypothetical protein [Sphingomonas oryzagri]
MTQERFNPADPECWRSRGRTPDQAALLASVWREYPDLPSTAPLEERMARSRARVAAMKPINDAMTAETGRRRQEKNFAFTTSRVAWGTGDQRDVAILRGRNAYDYDWNHAIRYADGWQAADKGWEFRPFVSGPSEHAAYDRGFRDGGGDIADLFDTARRAMRVATCKADQPLLVSPTSARPLPSSWPKPTDAPRPSRWERRLVIIAGEDVEPARAEAPALDHFTGDLFDRIRAHDGGLDATIVILTAAHGFIDATEIMQPHCAIFSPARATELAEDQAQRERLRDLLGGREFDDILVIAEGPALDVIDAHAAALPLCRTMERTRHTPLLRRGQLRLWLDRGLAPGVMMASGHIRWGKAIKGLTGRLGDFTARYAGRAPDRGHILVIEHGNGVPACGFMTPGGEPLDPSIRFSSKSRMRTVMAQALRTFAAAMPVPRGLDLTSAADLDRHEARSASNLIS